MLFVVDLNIIMHMTITHSDKLHNMKYQGLELSKGEFKFSNYLPSNAL